MSERGLGLYDLGMATLNDVTAFLQQIAPLHLAADWDAVGLLVGSRRESCERVMTCLTLTPDVAAEAAREAADLVVTHHPLPFRPVARVTDDTPAGASLLTLLCRLQLTTRKPHALLLTIRSLLTTLLLTAH